MDTNTNITAPSRAQVDRDIGELLCGIVHALPQVTLGQTRRPSAQSRASEFRAAFLALRNH